jgi:hypothetical protein
MPGKNRNPLLGWHPPAELSAWARAEAQRRSVALSVILTEALEQYRDHCTALMAATPAGPTR